MLGALGVALLLCDWQLWMYIFHLLKRNWWRRIPLFKGKQDEFLTWTFLQDHWIILQAVTWWWLFWYQPQPMTSIMNMLCCSCLLIDQCCSSEFICIPFYWVLRVLSAFWGESLFVMLQAFGISTSILTMSWVLHRWKRCTQWEEFPPPKDPADWLALFISRGQDYTGQELSRPLHWGLTYLWRGNCKGIQFVFCFLFGSFAHWSGSFSGAIMVAAYIGCWHCHRTASSTERGHGKCSAGWQMPTFQKMHG